MFEWLKGLLAQGQQAAPPKLRGWVVTDGFHAMAPTICAPTGTMHGDPFPVFVLPCAGPVTHTDLRATTTFCSPNRKHLWFQLRRGCRRCEWYRANPN